MDCKLNRIFFVVTLLRLSLLRRLCKAYDLLKKESRVCKEYDIHSVSWNHCVNDGKKEKKKEGNSKNCFPHSQYYYFLASFFDPNKSSNSEFQSSARTPGSFNSSNRILSIVAAAAALTLFVRSYGSSSMA